MKKIAKTSTKTPTIEELLKRLEMLENQNAELKAKLQENNELEAKLKWLEKQLRLLQHKSFNASSEKALSGKLKLFNEVEKNQI